MSSGKLLTKLLAFSFQLFLTNLLQLTFNMVDLIIVGRFSGENSLAAVGSSGPLVTLIVCVLTGISVGVNVLSANYFGAKDAKSLNATINVAVIVAVAGGVIIGILGVSLAKQLLKVMGTPDSVISLAALYLRIYFCGLPIIILYNFASAVLRAVGDTRHPLYFLTLAGVIHVALNLVFVIVMRLDVAGVALGTVLSQCVSCVMVVRCLVKSEGIFRLDIRHIRFSRKQFARLMRIGIPAGIQGSFFSLSNITIQSAVNSFGTAVMAGNSAGVNIESFLYSAQDSIAQAALSSVSQNMGAREFERTKKTVLECTLLEIIVSMLLCYAVMIFRHQLIGIYTPDAAAVEIGATRLLINGAVYFTNGLMNMMASVMRGHGYSYLPTVITLLGVCAFRIVWVYTAFAWTPTLPVLYISYPISWTLTTITHYISYFALRKKAWAECAAR